MASICSTFRKTLAEDSMFPFKENPSVTVKISFKVGDKKLTVEKWKVKTDVWLSHILEF
jgi:hypothetical protein